MDQRRSRRWSLLPALNINGYLNWTLYQGSINAVLYIDFIRRGVLLYCNPCNDRHLPNSVLVIDNASIYRNADLVRMCKETGVRIARQT